jgi:hypothetical protein
MYDSAVRAITDQTGLNKPLIIGETASYWGGGLANVSNRFASGFWYVNQLGYLAAHGYSLMIRQVSPTLTFVASVK